MNLRRTAAGVVALLASFAPVADAGDVVVSAGTIHPVDGDPITDGMVLVSDGVIVAVGKDLDVPPSVQVVDYGPGAVVVPGLVDADSGYALGWPSERTAAPGLSAVDGFDFYGEYSIALSSGVTSAYVTPSRNRLIAGQGAVVKLGGDDPERRLVNRSAAIHGSIGAAARSVPGFWEPPIPPTSDVGLGYAKPQLPRSTMGAIVALDELLDAVAAGTDADEYGPYTASDLAVLVERGARWRMGADTEAEVRALLDLADRRGFRLVVDGAREATAVASDLATADVPVIFRVPLRANVPAGDWGKDEDDYWPDFAVPARLAEAGVRVGIGYAGSPRDLLFAARLASRGGLDSSLALRAITLTPAEILGAADRIGSLSPGKDGDLAVFMGDPLAGGSPIATWLDGELVWSESSRGKSKKGSRASSSTVVIEVEELHVGDGEVLRPGALVLRDGRILDIGARVARPAGAQVVRGFAATPGMIDAFGHLGLEGSDNTPGTDFPMRKIITAGDDVDARVALAGVTTVVLGPRGDRKSGLPLTAYKPAAQSYDRQIVADPTTLAVVWKDRNRLEAGDDVRKLLEDAVEYRDEWQEYRTELAEWKAEQANQPPESDDDDGDEKDDDEDDDDKKKDKKKKDDDDEPEADPYGGIWEGVVERPPLAGELPIRIQLVVTDGEVDGSIRCAALSETLVDIEGRVDDDGLSVVGLGSQGWIELTGTAEKGELTGTIAINGTEIELEAKRTRADVPRASRPVAETESEDDGGRRRRGRAPRQPKRDPELEPFLAAMRGEGTIVVSVDREDEILDCVAAFERAGIRPVLRGATGLHHVADRVAGKVAGALLDHRVVTHDRSEGLEFVNRYARVAEAGIPIAFHSLAEEGAAELPVRATYAVANGLSFSAALRALTHDAAAMYGIDDRIGRLARGLDADVLVHDGPPLAPETEIVRVWVAGEEVTR